MNKTLFNANTDIIIEKERLSTDFNIWRNVQLLKALGCLCLPEYHRFKENLRIAEEDLQIEVDGKEIQIISLISTPNICIFTSAMDKCTQCIMKITHQCQCAHEIKLRGGFCKEDFESRHFRRDRVSGSLSGWTSKFPTKHWSTFVWMKKI